MTAAPVTTLEAVLATVERGSFPPQGGRLTLLPAPGDGSAAVISFTGHVFVAADIDHDWLAAHLRPGELSEAFLPPFLSALASRLELRAGAIDLLALAPPCAGPADIELTEVTDLDHPRVRRARRYRREVRLWLAGAGMIVLGRGLAGRWEVGLDVAAAARGQGLGRRLALAARHLVPQDRPLWAQIAGGNAASLRAFLAAGYRPVGQEILLVPW